MDTNKFIVCVHSCVYNHSKYINDCLRGFMMQEVDFPVVFMLEDDASTDGTQEILRKFVTENFNIDDKSVAKVVDFEGATTMFAQHKTNKNFYVAYIQMKYNHYSMGLHRDEYENEWLGNAHYVAMCEGDDYWIDPHKLQKQVDFLEKNPDVGLCYTDFNHYTEDGDKTVISCFENDIVHRPLSFEEHLLNAGYIAPMTWVWRSSFNQMLKQCFIKTDGTFAYALEFYKNSKVGYLPETTATYRFHTGSASNPGSSSGHFRQYKGVFDTQLYYADKYNVSQTLLDNIKSKAYFDLLPYSLCVDDKEFVVDADNFFSSKGIHFPTLIKQIKRINAQQSEIEHITRDYNVVVNSKAYKIGRQLLKPLKFNRK